MVVLDVHEVMEVSGRNSQSNHTRLPFVPTFGHCPRSTSIMHLLCPTPWTLLIFPHRAPVHLQITTLQACQNFRTSVLLISFHASVHAAYRSRGVNCSIIEQLCMRCDHMFAGRILRQQPLYYGHSSKSWLHTNPATRPDNKWLDCKTIYPLTECFSRASFVSSKARCRSWSVI